MASSKKWFTWKRAAVAFLLLLLGGWAGFQAVIRSDWFVEQLRIRVIAEIERATGGSAEIETLTFDPNTLTVGLINLQLRTPPQTEPFVLLPSSTLNLSIQSLLSASVRLDSLTLERPVVRLVIAADGSTNWPVRASNGQPLNLADIGLGRLEISQGQFFFNGEEYDVNVSAEAVALTAVLQPDNCYDLNTQTQNVRASIEDLSVDGAVASDLRFCGDSLQIERLELATSSYGTWTGSGSAAPLSDPTVDLDFAFESPLDPFVSGLPSGWSINGALSGTVAVSRTPELPISYNGRLDAADVAVRGPNSALDGIQLDADFAGDFDTVGISSLNLTLPAGVITGQAAVSDLRGQPLLVSEGSLQDVGVGSLIRLATPQFPWVGRASGSYRLTASESAGMALTSSVDIVNPGDASRPGLTGNAAFDYSSRSGELALHALNLSTQGILLNASGRLSEFRPSEASVTLRVEGQSDIEALLALAQQPTESLPFLLNGPASTTAEISSPGGLSRLADSRVQASLATDSIQLQDYQWDRFSANADFAEGRLTISEGRLVDGDGVVNFSGHALIDEANLPAQWPFDAHAELSGLALSKVITAAGLSVDAEGLLSLTADLSGPFDTLTAQGDFHVSDGSAAGQSFDSLSGSIEYATGRVSASSIELRRGGALLTGNGSFVPSERSFQLQMVASEMELDEIPPLTDSASPPHGLLSFNLTASGALSADSSRTGFDALTVNGSWSIQDLEFAGTSLGAWSGEASGRGTRVELTLSGTSLNGSVSGAAAIDPTDLGFTADIRFAGLAIENLMAAEEEEASSNGPTGVATGEARFEGSLNSLSEIRGEGLFSELRLEIVDVPGTAAGYELYNPFPMRWAFSAGSLRLDHMRLQGAGTNVELTGGIGLLPEIDSDLRIEGDFNLAGLQTLQPNLAASGRSRIGVRLTGDLADPEIQGEWVIQDGSIQPENSPVGLSGVNGRVMFVGREIRVEEMRAASGGGVLTLSGGGRIAADNYEFRLDAHAQNVRVRYPAGITSVVDGDFVFSGAKSNRLLGGEVVIQRLSTARNTTLGTLLSTLRSGTPTAAESTPSDSVQINVHLTSAPGVEINTTLIRNVAASIDLRLVGTLGNPSLLGNINVAQGEMTFHGSRYAINRGEIEFRNPIRIEPLLDFELETRIRGVDIALILAGPARRLNVSYRSDPPLSFSDLVNLVAVGRDPTTDPLSASRQRVEQQSLFQTGANNVLAQAVQRPVSPGLQRFFGVSRLKVDPAVGGAESNPAARVSTEQQLTDDLTLIYTYDLSSAQQQTARLEWTPDRRWTFVVTRDENGLVGSDAIYKLRRP